MKSKNIKELEKWLYNLKDEKEIRTVDIIQILNDFDWDCFSSQLEPLVSDDFGGNKQLKDTLTLIYELAKKGKTLEWGFDRKTKGQYNFNIKLDVSEYDSQNSR
jgi:hypothetical protein